jgi:hypothetical protein
MKHQIISNFLNKDEFVNIKNIFTNNTFPWFLSKGIVSSKDSDYQFTHVFFDMCYVTSNFFKDLLPIIKKLEMKSIVRIKANLLAREKKIIEHGYHVDFNYSDSKTAVFYINTNNGYTKFKNGYVSKSEENKIIIFNCMEEHTGTSCTDEDFRIVLNLNYF